jgi:DNA repair protein RadA/Sms
MALATRKTVYLCSSCGTDFPKWFGQCPACREWGTLSEFQTSRKKKSGRSQQPAGDTKSLKTVMDSGDEIRILTRINEVDRVLGGGLLRGTLLLLGGNPGIGKSTLALQMMGSIDENTTLYVSGEESYSQIAIRAKRLKINSDNLNLSAENSVENIIEQIQRKKSAFLVIDSIQTVYSDLVDSLPGSISQIRECGQQFLQLCKRENISIIIIGHVTKEGIIAGPKMLEHMVDTVLYLEGDERYDHRILRSVKNRFGTTNEVGIFQMRSNGLVEVSNPSELFLSERSIDAAGSSIYPSVEGTRPILIEVQALVSKASFGTPQRNVNGYDIRRLSMLLAVLEKRLKIPMGMNDTFVNLVGGIKIDDPAADLAVISSIASSIKNKPIDPDMVLVGEVGLAGEVRSVSNLVKRLVEAQTLGFKAAVTPRIRDKITEKLPDGIKINEIQTVSEAFVTIFD